MYRPTDDYCNEAKNWQSVPSFEQMKAEYPQYTRDEINDKRENIIFSCDDSYQMGSIQDNQIYISTTSDQHNQIAETGKSPDYKLSGYFSDEATVNACTNEKGVLDNGKYNEALQTAPYQEKGNDGKPISEGATYKPYVDCFEIDRNALEENYRTRDFNAAIAKCEANNQFGSGGGNQGYNPCINEMIDNGSLKYNPDKSFTDQSVLTRESANHSEKAFNKHYGTGRFAENGCISQVDYREIMDDVHKRSADCVRNNTPHPSSEACNNGFSKENALHIDSNTGHATTWKKAENVATGQSEVRVKIKTEQGKADGIRAGPDIQTDKSDLLHWKTKNTAEKLEPVTLDMLSTKESSPEKGFQDVSIDGLEKDKKTIKESLGIHDQNLGVEDGIGVNRKANSTSTGMNM